MHDQGPTEADVTEGSSGVWERLHYDWSDPDQIVLTTTDSNAWADGPSHTYTLERQPDGTTEIDYSSRARRQEPQGPVPRGGARNVGKGRLSGAFEKFVKAIEARDNGSGPAEPSSEQVKTQ